LVSIVLVGIDGIVLVGIVGIDGIEFTTVGIIPGTPGNGGKLPGEKSGEGAGKENDGIDPGSAVSRLLAPGMNVETPGNEGIPVGDGKPGKLGISTAPVGAIRPRAGKPGKPGMVGAGKPGKPGNSGGGGGIAGSGGMPGKGGLGKPGKPGSEAATGTGGGGSVRGFVAGGSSSGGGGWKPFWSKTSSGTPSIP
jgi:hypothetical protein